MRQEDDKKIRRVVVKVGSSTLTHSTGKLNLRRIDALASTLTDIKNSGRDVILVTSGAVAAGMAKLSLDKRPLGNRQKQAVASVGQCALMHIYDKVFGEYGQSVGQILMTKEVFQHEKSRENAQNTFETLFEFDVIPIVNENDTISTDELESLSGFGDNDRLSAGVAVLCQADILIILTDFDGLYDGDPRKDNGACQIPLVTKVDDELLALAGGAGSKGTGGMATKLAAAKVVMDAGINMIITDGSDPRVLLEICDGTHRGTLFTTNPPARCV